MALVDLAGSVFAYTSAGDVHGEGIRCTSVAVEADAGDAELRLMDQADLMDVDTAAGDTTITTPGDAYRVTTETSAGDIGLDGIRRDSSRSHHRMVAPPRAGDISLEAR